MNALTLFRRWWDAPFVRVAVWSGLALAGLAGGIVLAYELALARVPQHRATLERLVRAQTGLDVRFNELNLRWGWYGPEAVFRRVELGEPGRSNVLVRAPQLVVGFDAWRSMQSGQLQAGRITFIAPDINLERRAQAAQDPTRPRDAASQNRVRLLQRWRGGRIEIEGGLLRLPDPAGAADALALQIRRASLRRSDDQWSASALMFLPDRLGHTARIAAQLKGDLTSLSNLTGTLRFDGLRLAFAGWRHVLGASSTLTKQLPTAGGGDVSFRVSFDRGRIEKAEGRVRAQDVLFAEPPWFVPESAQPMERALNLPRLRADWRLAHRDTVWQLRIEELDLGAKEDDAPRPDFALEIAARGREVRGDLGETPLESLAAMVSWLAPQLDLTGVELEGAARDIRFDWNGARREGERLRASASVEQITFAPPSRSFTLGGLAARLAGSETGIDISLDSDHGQLAIARSPEAEDSAPELTFADLRIVSQLRLNRTAGGWRLTTPRLSVDHGTTQLVLNGHLDADPARGAPLLDANVSLARADVPMLRDILRESAVRRFGAVASQLTAGQIERAAFKLQAELDGESARPPEGVRQFAGSLMLRGGQIAGGELWPQVQGLDAQLDWHGERMRAVVEQGRAGSMELVSGQARWSTAGRQPTQISGQVRGRLEDALPWLSAHPRLEEYTPQLRHLAARGEALFNFDVVLPASHAPSRARPRVRVAALLDRARLQLTPDLSSIESVRGSLAFDTGRLQRSTLTGSWLGGPLTLRISERRERRATVLVAQAQGLADAQQLVALTGFEALPEVAGQTPWTGELTYEPETAARRARWQLEAEASLVGVSSRLPEPLAKPVVAAMPLRIEAFGSGNTADVRVSLADRMRSRLALVRVQRGGAVNQPADSQWRVERGAINFGNGAATVPGEPLIAVHGHVNRFDLPAYASLWQRAGNLVKLPAMVADLIAEQLWLADRMFPDVRVQARKAAGTSAELHLESPALSGSVRWPGTADRARIEVHLTALNLDAAERARIVTHLQDSWNNPIVTLN